MISRCIADTVNQKCVHTIVTLFPKKKTEKREENASLFPIPNFWGYSGLFVLLLRSRLAGNFTES